MGCLLQFFLAVFFGEGLILPQFAVATSSALPIQGVTSTNHMSVINHILSAYRNMASRSTTTANTKAQHGFHTAEVLAAPLGLFEHKDRNSELGLSSYPEGGQDAAEEEHQPDFATLEEVVVACHKVIKYFRSHVTQMNLDAVIGTRIAEAQFKMVLNTLEDKARSWMDGSSSSKAFMNLVTFLNGLRALYRDAHQLNSVAEPFIKATFPDYYADLGKILKDGFWEVPLSTKVFNSTAEVLSNPSDLLDGVEQLDEGQSDECVSEAGHADPSVDNEEALNANKDISQDRCSLSQECWDLMTRPGYSGYSLTHQVFYLVIGLQAGCGYEEEIFAHNTVRNGSHMTVTSLLKELCYSILIEANTIAEAEFPEGRRDLFMEQGALCGLMGYRDFFRKQWLAKVLSWQRPIGCYGDFLLYDSSNKHLLVEKITYGSVHSRIKREEKPMPGRCLAHRSAVAVGYLSLYVRYLALALFK